MQPNFSLFSDNLTNALGWMVIHSLWQATAIAILTGIVLIFLRKKAANIRYVVSNIALFTVFAVSVATFAYYYETDAPSSTMIITSSDPSVNPVIKLANDPNEMTVTVDNNRNATVSNRNLLSLDVFKGYFTEHLPLIVTIWLLGVVAFLLRLMGGISYVYYLKSRMNFPADEYWLDMMDKLAVKTNLKKGVDLVESALTRTPMVVGHATPMILFPLGVLNRLSPQEVEAILAHELAHVLRHDYIFNILQSVVESLFYFHPAVWWLSSQIRNERESCCDEIAINLIGNSVNYAKALVAIQEMAYFPMTPALAFAGQARKSQFLMRMQRILNQSNNKSNVMEKLIATIFIILTIVGLNIAQGDSEQKNLTSTDDTFIQTSDDAPLSMSGIWQSELVDGKLEIQFSSKSKNSNWNSNETFEKSELSAMPTSEGSFTITRNAGVMEMMGKFEGNDGYGKFTFKPSEELKTFLASQGTEGVKDETLMHCFLANLGKDFVVFMNQKGYKSLTNKQLQELAIFRMDKNWVNTYVELFNKNGISNPSISKLVELKIHGVSPDYISMLQQYGYVDVPLNKILEAKIHGVSADFIQSFGERRREENYNLQDLIEFKIHGIDGEFVKNLEAKSGKKLSHDRIVEAKIHNFDRIDFKKMEDAGVKVDDDDDRTAFAIHNVDEKFVTDLKAVFGSKMDNSDFVAAKIHGLTAEVAKGYKAAFGDLDFDDALSFKIHGITTDYVQNLKKSGFPNISADDAMSFKIHGMTPQYLTDLKNAGFKNISIDDAMAFKIHGVSPEMWKGLADLGYKNLDPDDLVAFKIHGVTPQFIRELNDLGFKNIDSDDLVACRIHGVNAATIKEMNEKGFKSGDLQDYINKRVRGNWGSSSKRNINVNTNLNVNVDAQVRAAERLAEAQIRKTQAETESQARRSDKDLNRQQRDLQRQQDELNRQQNELSRQQSELGRLNADLGFDNKALNWFFTELERDGLLKFGRQTEIRFNNSRLTINGEKLSATQYEKYKKGIAAKLTKPLKQNFKFNFEGKVKNMTNDNFEMSGNMDIDLD